MFIQHDFKIVKHTMDYDKIDTGYRLCGGIFTNSAGRTYWRGYVALNAVDRRLSS